MKTFYIDTTKAPLLVKGLYKKPFEKSVTKSLNNSAFHIRQKTVSALPGWLNLTRNFLPKSVVYESATPVKDYSRVGFLARADRIMLLEKGGTRRPKQGLRMISVPTRNIRKRTRGNTPRAILGRKNTFLKRINNVLGVWRTMKSGGLKLLYHMNNTTSYRGKNIRFLDLAEREFYSNFPRFMRKNFEEQMRKAK